jgi:hypothetical protein
VSDIPIQMSHEFAEDYSEVWIDYVRIFDRG